MALGRIESQSLATPICLRTEPKLPSFQSFFTEAFFQLRELVQDDSQDPVSRFESSAGHSILLLSKLRTILSDNEGPPDKTYNLLATSLGMSGPSQDEPTEVSHPHDSAREYGHSLQADFQAEFQTAWAEALGPVLKRIRKASRNRVWLRRRFIIHWFSDQMQSGAAGALVSSQVSGTLAKTKAKHVITVLYAAGVVKKRGPLKVSDNVIRRDVQLVKRIFLEEKTAIFAEERLLRLKSMLDWACRKIVALEEQRSELESA